MFQNPQGESSAMTMTFTFARAPLSISFEVGSLAEGIAALQEQETALRTIITMADSLNTAPASATAEEQTGDAAKDKPAGRGRGRPSTKDKNQPDPSTAQAPAPMPVGETVPPTAPVDTTPNANGVPAFLDRQSAPPPPVPSAPPPPPPAPVIPPSGILAGKIIADLDKRATDDANKKALADWIAAHQIVKAGATYDDAIGAIRLMADDKLAQLASGLGIAV